MDKYEYRVRAEQIKSLLAKKEYVEAMRVADTVDWHRVKSISMLCTVSEIYKINRKYEESREVLLLAYERYPTGRMIVYALCELSIKMEDFVQAVEYYKEYVQIAPKDTAKYILQYKLYEAQDVSLEERIEVLEEFKKHDYREKWAYELAYLYHRIGLGTKCVEECDELILWFGEGKYVTKAMELKMLHETLTPLQQEKYLQVNPMAAEAMQSVPVEPEVPKEQIPIEIKAVNASAAPTRELPSEDIAQAAENLEDNISVPTVNVGQYNTINLQAELARSMQELLGDEQTDETAYKQPAYEEVRTEYQQPAYDAAQAEHQQPVYDGTVQAAYQQPAYAAAQAEYQQSVYDDTAQAAYQQPAYDTAQTEYQQPQETAAEEVYEAELLPENGIVVSGPEVTYVDPDGEGKLPFEDILAQDKDGQISFSLPEQSQVEKQITGQMNIEDILAEWERMKKENDKRRMEEAKKRSLEQTNDIMSQLVGVIPGLEPMKLEEEKTTPVIKMPVQKPAARPQTHVGEVPKSSPSKIIPMPLPAAPKAPSPAIARVVMPDGTKEGVYAGIKQIVDDDMREMIPVYEEEQIPDYETEPEAEELSGEDLAEEMKTEAEAVKDAAVDDMAETEEIIEEDAGEAEEMSVMEDEAEEDTAGDLNGGDIPTAELPQIELADEDAIKEELEASDEPFVPAPIIPHEMTEEEEHILSAFIDIKPLQPQILHALSAFSMTPATGNMIITGQESSGREELAMDMLKIMQLSDAHFEGKIAKIKASALNKKNLDKTLKQLSGSVLYVEEAGELSEKIISRLPEALEAMAGEIMIVLIDEKEPVDEIVQRVPELALLFNARIDIPEYTNDDLVAYATGYARGLEYSIDEMGTLALYTKIGELQLVDYAATIYDAKDIIDEAIHNVRKKSVSHLMDVMLAKRYDEDDYIILREKDFLSKKEREK